MKLRFLIFTMVIFIFFGCGDIETYQDDNSSTLYHTPDVLSIDNITLEERNNSIESEATSSQETLSSDINISDNNSTIIDKNITTQGSELDNESEYIIDDSYENIEEEQEEEFPQPIENNISTTTTSQTPSEEIESVRENNNTENNNTEDNNTETIVDDYKSRFINESKCSQIVDKEFFEVCYDYSKKAAKSVAYTLEGDLVNELNIQERPAFYEEESIDEKYRAKYRDYTNSGYDRGHLAPDASFDWSQDSLEATYSLANIIPQEPEVNRYMWVKVEKYARDKAVEFGLLNVVNVVRYDNNHTKYIGEDNISVSIGYYKILSNQDESYKECFYYANSIDGDIKDDNLSQHRVDCQSI